MSSSKSTPNLYVAKRTDLEQMLASTNNRISSLKKRLDNSIDTADYDKIKQKIRKTKKNKIKITTRLHELMDIDIMEEALYTYEKIHPVVKKLHI